MLVVTLADRGIHLRQPTPFTPSRSAFAARLREGAARSPFVLVSARPHLRVAAQDRCDTAARRRARLPWRACDGTRQEICAGLRALRRSSVSASGAMPEYTATY